MPTEHGSTIYKGSQSGVDASIVGLLRAAGAIIIGKTVCTPYISVDKETDSRSPLNLPLVASNLDPGIHSILPNASELLLQVQEPLYRIISVIWHSVLKL
jgi:hypothetical protein